MDGKEQETKYFFKKQILEVLHKENSTCYPFHYNFNMKMTMCYLQVLYHILTPNLSNNLIFCRNKLSVLEE